MSNNVIYVDFKSRKKIKNHSKLSSFFSIKKIKSFFNNKNPKENKNDKPYNMRLKIYNYKNQL
ncbi:hypothetical protein KQI36_12905 [Clostridium senegalense]|uniref:hypothetical protein n=1 Tax=Clostridium senegalense TaxID=1465809 RepID=UPI001C10AB0F|nr:hypothetical protein [Clostridium senegalense]MBU5227532.1 hypothetical protein [Clostridium senegalense]